MTIQADIAARLAEIRASIEAASARAGRAADAVALVAVSKSKPIDAIRAAYEAGQRDFGENYVQELLQKRAALAGLADLRWHFIGGLQRNKARHVVDVALVHTIDRVELGVEIDRRARAANARTAVLVEVNVGGEAQKSGCAPGDLPGLLEALAPCAGIVVSGLMTVPPASDDPAVARGAFAALRALRDRHAAALGRGELSMGMSHDFEDAIAEGATLVRVGTAIFGAR